MDKLPSELLDRIIRERSAGATWDKIEKLSPVFEEWQKTPAAVRAKFAGLRLPHTSLLRWYDLRVEQPAGKATAEAIELLRVEMAELLHAIRSLSRLVESLSATVRRTRPGGSQ